MKNYCFFYTLFFITFSIYGCKSKSNKKFKIDYYSSGNLKSKGWYLYDTIPVDSTINFFENGKILSIERRNSIGILNGISTLYHKNGNLFQEINYVGNIVQGFSYQYDTNGILKSRIYYLNNDQFGDSYWYYENGIIRKYSFLDFNHKTRNLIIYDSFGNILKDDRTVILVDSTVTYSDSLDRRNFGSYDVMIALSNPPKCQTSFKINYITKHKIVYSDSIVTKQYYVQKRFYSDSIIEINYYGKQYDSIKNRYSYQTGKILIDN